VILSEGARNFQPVILSDERSQGPRRAPVLRSLGWRSEESKACPELAEGDPYTWKQV